MCRNSCASLIQPEKIFSALIFFSISNLFFWSIILYTPYFTSVLYYRRSVHSSQELFQELHLSNIFCLVKYMIVCTFDMSFFQPRVSRWKLLKFLHHSFTACLQFHFVYTTECFNAICTQAQFWLWIATKMKVALCLVSLRDTVLFSR